MYIYGHLWACRGLRGPFRVAMATYAPLLTSIGISNNKINKKVTLLLLLYAPPLPILLSRCHPVRRPVPHAREGRSSGSRVSSFPREFFFLRLISMALEIRVESSPITDDPGPQVRTAPALFSHCAGLGYLQISLVSGFSAVNTADVA